MRDTHLLLLLDNFEHLLASAPLVSALLAAGPRLKVLVTSRSVLHLSGEHTFPVPPLTLPDPRRLHATGDDLVPALADYEAVRLFMARAAAARPDFTLTTDNAPAVAEICHRLDGLPLAIELAAARLKVLSPPALLARLESASGGLPLLTGGPRDLPARQQTLRATIAWSHDLLTAPEQRLFRRLAVFAGGCTLAAAEAVCNVGGDLGGDVLDGMAALVDCSLLEQETAALPPTGADRREVASAGRQPRPDGGLEGSPSSNDDPRFVMLETIREFGLEQLEASGEAATIRRRHAAHFLAVAETAEPELRSGAAAVSAARLDADLDNLRAALGWCVDDGDAEVGLRLVGALTWYWEREHVGEGRRWAEALLMLTDAARHAGARARGLWAAGALAATQGAYAVARGRLGESVATSRAVGDTSVLAYALMYLGFVLFEDQPAAQACIEESAMLFRRQGDRWGLVWALTTLGRVTQRQGDAASARAWCEEGLALAREIGEPMLLVAALNSLAEQAMGRRDDVTARALYAEAVGLQRDTGRNVDAADALTNLSLLLLRQGDHRRATALLAEALPLYRQLGVPAGVAGSLEVLAGVALQRKQPERAARLFGATAAIREAAQVPVLERYAGLHRATTTAIRTALGEEAFAGAYAAGRAAPLDDIIAEALVIAAPAAPATSLEQPAPVYPDRLTAREVEVLRLLAQGKSNREIAEALFISYNTVERHINHIFAKTGVANRVEAATYAHRHGLAD